MWGQPSLPDSLEIEGRAVALKVKRNPRARRVILRLDAGDGSAVLTLPPGLSNREALAFLEKNRGWLAARLKRLPETIPFDAGTEIPILGEPHLIVPRPDARRGLWREEGRLFVSGKPEHLARRVTDYLKAEGKKVISGRAQEQAARIGAKVKRVTLRDTRSRWGSCSHEGALSFSWRLILAPEPVLDYVVAHEVAHLLQMNHSPAFWRLVAELHPEHERDRAWLKREGAGLWRYG
jgi:predicted metal-dependent hydrolase